MRWFESFLAFAAERRGRPFEEVWLAWLEGLREAGRHTDWQIRQAADAVSIYRHQFRRAGEADRRRRQWPSGRQRGEGVGHVVRELKTKARSPLDDL